MTSYLPEALGQVVRHLRREEGLTQEKLGRTAGYQGGAGVSISRLENGQLEPSLERFEGLAVALGLTPEELAARAVAKTRSLKIATAADESVAVQRTRLQHELDDWKRLIGDREREFSEAHDRAKNDFLMRLVEIAARVHGASPEPIRPLAKTNLNEEGAESEADYRLQFTRLGVEHALSEAESPGSSYSAFTEAVVLGTLSRSLGISKLPGAALNGLLAATGVRTTPVARGAVGGLALLAVAAGGLLLVGHQRSRKQQQEVAAKLDDIEAQIAETRPSVNALLELMPRATELLEYTAIHAGHALDRWEAQIGQGELDLQSLSMGEQQRYQDFVEVAAAQLAVTTIEFRDLMTNRDGALERSSAIADEILSQSRRIITSHV